MGMGSDNSGYGDFILLSFVAESRKRPSTAACVCGSKSANPPSPPRNSLAHAMACFASLSVIDSCAEVLSLVYPMAIESCVPRLSQELNMFTASSGAASPLNREPLFSVPTVCTAPQCRLTPYDQNKSTSEIKYAMSSGRRV